MSDGRAGWAAVAALLVALPAHAFDVTGSWYVEEVVSDLRCKHDYVQTGTSVTISSSGCVSYGLACDVELHGTVDPTTRHVSAIGSISAACDPGRLCAGTFGVEATVDASGRRIAGDFVCGAPFPFRGTRLPPGCGNGILDAEEPCDPTAPGSECCTPTCVSADLGAPCADDGSVCTGDVCDGAGRCDHSGPPTGCVVAGRATLAVDESRPGEETLEARLSRLASDGNATDFGNPVGGDTAFTLCLQHESGDVAGRLDVDRAGDVCDGGQPCWRWTSKGYGYRDRAGTADGMRRIEVTTGHPGRSAVRLRAKSDAAGSLPTGIASLLRGSTRTTLRLVTSDARCFDGMLTKVWTDDGRRFRATGRQDR